MKRLFFFLLIAGTAGSAFAQEGIPQVPPPKNVMKIKKPTDPVPTRPIAKPVELQIPNNVAFVLTSNNWNLTRWWTTGNIGHSTTCPGFKFTTSNTIVCNCYIPDARAFIQAGTYSINGNDVRVTLKKDNTISFIFNLVYNSTNKTLTGTYTLQVFAVPDPPQGYMPGSVTGDIKLEIQQ